MNCKDTKTLAKNDIPFCFEERGCEKKMKPQVKTYSKSRRLKNQIKAVVTNPYNVILLIAVILQI